MKTWQDDHLNSLLHMVSQKKILNKLGSTARQMGFEFCAYGIQMPIPISHPSVTLINNYPSEWQAAYAANNYLDIDPTVAHGRTSCLPLIWDAALYQTAPTFWEDARGQGIHAGWSLSTRDASGAVGMLTLARSGEQISKLELYGKASRMGWLAQFVHVAMSRLLLPDQVPDTQAILTLREKEVLRWTAEGKTAFEIAQILLVSERTINFHINNVVVKLGSANKTQAAVKATVLGLLF